MLEYILIICYILVSFGVASVCISEGADLEKYPDLNNLFGKIIAFIIMTIIWPFFAGVRLGTKLDLY